MQHQKRLSWLVSFAFSFSLFCISGGAVTGQDASGNANDIGLNLHEIRVKQENVPGVVSLGTFRVYEDREKASGRIIEVDVAVLHALGQNPRPDPVFILEGGPGLASVRSFASPGNTALRKTRDVVLVNQRGTAGPNALTCETSGSDEDIQSYLGPILIAELFEKCEKVLSKRANLALYSTPIAMDDLNDIRAALAYEKINIIGKSYGSRATQVYLRRHPDTVRSAILNGVVALENTTPLYHAESAQFAIDRIFELCSKDVDCSAAYPNPASELKVVLKRLEREPATVEVSHPITKLPVTVTLSRDAFAGALRLFLYGLPGNFEVPKLINKAFNKEYTPFAERGMYSGKGVREALAFGMFLSVGCSEDGDRIDLKKIDSLTKDTFLGASRVRDQMASCEVWPRSQIQDGFGDMPQIDVPVLLISGTLDPVTPPYWGERAAATLTNSFHMIVPGAHVARDQCSYSIMEEFLATASTEGLDLSCVKGITFPPFSLPASFRESVNE